MRKFLLALMLLGAFVTNSNAVLVDPLTSSPTALYATYRLPNCQSVAVMQLYNKSTGDLFDVSDTKLNGVEYKDLSGNWVSSAGGDWYTAKFYDQVSNTAHDLVAGAGSRGKLTFNAKGGRPVVYVGSTSAYVGVGAASTYLTTSAYTMFFTGAHGGVFASASSAYSLPLIMGDNGGYVGWGVGSVSGKSSQASNGFNYDGNEDISYVSMTNTTWATFSIVHSGGNLDNYSDGSLNWRTASGNTSSLSSVFKALASTASPVGVSLTSFATFNKKLSDEEFLNVNNYFNAYGVQTTPIPSDNDPAYIKEKCKRQAPNVFIILNF